MESSRVPLLAPIDKVTISLELEGFQNTPGASRPPIRGPARSDRKVGLLQLTRFAIHSDRITTFLSESTLSPWRLIAVALWPPQLRGRRICGPSQVVRKRREIPQARVLTRRFSCLRRNAIRRTSARSGGHGPYASCKLTWGGVREWASSAGTPRTSRLGTNSTCFSTPSATGPPPDPFPSTCSWAAGPGGCTMALSAWKSRWIKTIRGAFYFVLIVLLRLLATVACMCYRRVTWQSNKSSVLPSSYFSLVRILIYISFAQRPASFVPYPRTRPAPAGVCAVSLACLVPISASLKVFFLRSSQADCPHGGHGLSTAGERTMRELLAVGHSIH